jgi:excinuclease ABC subunit C
MHEAAEALRFEEAQIYKDKLDLLLKYQSKSTVVSPNVGDVEVYSISSTDKLAFVNFLRVSQGIIVISRNVEVRKKINEPEDEILVHVIGEMRSHYGDGCNEMITGIPIDWPDENATITHPKV